MEKKRRKIIKAVVFLSIILTLAVALIGFDVTNALSNMVAEDDKEARLVDPANNILHEGKNKVYFSGYHTAKKLANNNPDIETISYYDETLERTVGYISAFGGLGKDFTIYPGRIYEINAKRDISIMMDA